MPLSRRALLRNGIVLALGSTMGAPGRAQDAPGVKFPARPIRLVVPAPPGGSTDVLARLIGSKMADIVGQPVIVDNRAGGNTMIGTNYVVRAPADGYTLLVHINSLLQMQYIYKNLPFDVFADLTPVSQLALSRNLFVVAADVPANTLAEFAALSKAEPEAFNYGSYGNGTASHL